jgi:hypothetical protein
MDSPPFAISGARWRAMQSELVDVESTRSRSKLRDKLVRPFSLGAPLRLPVNLGNFIVLAPGERVSLARVIRRDIPLCEGVGWARRGSIVKKP